MDAVYFSGSSDDLIEVEGKVPGCDEYNSEDEHFLAIGPAGKVRLRVWFTRRGLWAIAIAPVAEDVPMLAVSFEAVQTGYSARALVEGVEMVVHEAKGE